MLTDNLLSRQRRHQRGARQPERRFDGWQWVCFPIDHTVQWPHYTDPNWIKGLCLKNFGAGNDAVPVKR
jgi:hypothetical protein